MRPDATTGSFSRVVNLKYPGSSASQKNPGVASAPDQGLGIAVWGSDGNDVDAPVVDYGGDVVLEDRLRRDWENCEMRTFLVAY